MRFIRWEDSLGSGDDLEFSFVSLVTSKGRCQVGIGFVSVL